MKCDKETMLLYAVTDRTWTKEKTLFQQVEEALEGGVTCVQLREKELAKETFLLEAIEMKVICEKYHVPLIINDNVEIALRCDADGIHVGQKDMSAEDVRAKIGDEKILGVSVQTVEQAILAEKNGADYLGVGAVFSTSTKLDANAVSYGTLKDICKSVKIPVVAIGGIHEGNILELKGSGVDGVALVSAIFGSKHIKEQCRQLKKLSQEMVSYK
ncbi:MAG: thiamine phosphate synthase [Cellulosilyticum sp.]|nr:thiamine phosphate synthase [Cellulosilyticum sp.]